MAGIEGGDGAYRTSVNEGDVNMKALARELNEQAEQGYRLHSAVDNNGNLVLIYERRA